MTGSLLDAAAQALELEARETCRSRRAALLAWTRATLTQWKTGVLTTEQAVARLQACPATRPPLAGELSSPV